MDSTVQKFNSEAEINEYINFQARCVIREEYGKLEKQKQAILNHQETNFELEDAKETYRDKLNKLEVQRVELLIELEQRKKL